MSASAPRRVRASGLAATSSASPAAVASSTNANRNASKTSTSATSFRTSAVSAFRKTHSNASTYAAYVLRSRLNTLSRSPSAHINSPCGSRNAFTPEWWHGWNASSGSHAWMRYRERMPSSERESVSLD